LNSGAEGIRRAPDRRFIERQRNIFYDTDGISESQEEVIRLCAKCPGTFKIDSHASTGYRVLGIHLPWSSCPECREQALLWFDKSYGDRYYAVYLQDMDRDEYTVRVA
jgi:hypothetical protein